MNQQKNETETTQNNDGTNNIKPSTWETRGKYLSEKLIKCIVKLKLGSHFNRQLFKTVGEKFSNNFDKKEKQLAPMYYNFDAKIIIAAVIILHLQAKEDVNEEYANKAIEKFGNLLLEKGEDIKYGVTGHGKGELPIYSISCFNGRCSFLEDALIKFSNKLIKLKHFEEWRVKRLKKSKRKSIRSYKQQKQLKKKNQIIFFF